MSSTHGRGRPRKTPTTSKLAPRDELVAAAIEIVSESGLDGLTVSALADRVNVARSAVYHHFGTVDHVIAAIGASVMVPLFDELVEIADTDACAADRLRRYFQREVELIVGSGLPIAAIVSHPRLREPAHEGFWASIAGYEEPLALWLMEATGVDHDEAVARLRGAAACSLGFNALAHPTEDRPPIETALAMVFRLVGVDEQD